MLRFWNADLKHVSEPGSFDVMINGSSVFFKPLGFTLK